MENTTDPITETEHIPYYFIRNYNLQSKGQIDLDSFSDFIIILKDETYAKEKGLEIENEKNKLKELIEKAGLVAELSNLGHNKLGFFITCNKKRLLKQYKEARIYDYIHGMRVADLDKLINTDTDTGFIFSKAQRVRLVYNILMGKVEEMGAGIFIGEESLVECVYPVHDRAFNRIFLKKIVKTWRLKEEDLNQLKDHFGEELAYYFAFLDFYFTWLPFPAILSLVSIIIGIDPTFQSILNLFWATLFVEKWGIKQRDLAVKWEVYNCSKVEKIRPEFKGGSIHYDPVLNELVTEINLWEMWSKRLASIPLILILGGILSILVLLSFIVEIIITDYYEGPFKSYFAVLPGLVYFVLVTLYSGVYQRFSHQLTLAENHRTESDHRFYLTQKIFIVNFLCSYLSIFLISWVYIPYCDEITYFLKQYLPLSKEVTKIGLPRLQTQLFFFIVTSTIINFITETILPVLLRYGGRTARTTQSIINERMAKYKNRSYNEINEDSNEESELIETSSSDGHYGISEETAKWALKKFENEYYELIPYDTFDDYAEMIIQFGYITLFTCVFPIAPIVALINNWVELRSDFFKIFISHRRPIPYRVESIGAWLGTMKFLLWLSSIVTGLLLFQFKTSQDLEGDHLLNGLLVAILWEHSWLAIYGLIRTVLRSGWTYAKATLEKDNIRLKKLYIERIRNSSSES